MAYQTLITSYPALGVAGESHSNARHTSIYQTAQNRTSTVVAGIAQVRTGIYDHTRWLTSNPTAANLVDGSQLVVVSRNRNGANPYEGTRIGAASSVLNFDGSNVEIPSDCQHLVMRRGIIWVVVEKNIDPNNPVYVRVAAPTNPRQGIGYFTDVADGTNTVEVTAAVSRDTMWCGTDAVSYLSAKDPNITEVSERRRSGLTRGFSIAPLSLRYV